MELRLTCLGSFQITLGGEVLTAFPTDKMRALLVYLAVEERVHARSDLAHLFWPGYSAESANNNLRQALHHLRQLLKDGAETPYLLTTRQTVHLNAETVIHVDATRFTRLLAECAAHPHTSLVACSACLARLQQAVDLYQGDFLAGFSLADCDPFEEWRRITQEQLHIHVLRAFTQLADAAESNGDTEGALDAAHRQLALEPWLEAAHRRIMRLLAQQGRRTAALAQYQRCRQVLADELGTAPDGETTALYEQIRSGPFLATPTKEPSLPPPLVSVTETQTPVSPPVSPPVPVYDWAAMPAVDFFVERKEELAQLTSWLTPAGGEELPARLISVLGIGGIGKTSLSAVVTRAVASRFSVVIWRSLLNAPPLGELMAHWLRLLSRQTLTSPPTSLDEQIRLLLTHLQQERCLLVLDNVESIFAPGDVGNPSGASFAGVTRPGYEGYDQLFQRLAGSEHQSCLLLTSREQPAALVRLGRHMQGTAGRMRLLQLHGLGQEAGQVVLESNGLRTTAAEAAQLVANYSGNPLALQIVAATITDFFGGDVAAFQREDGLLFDGLRLVLDQQFARLSPLERDILVWLAIEREPVTVSALRSNFAQPVATAPLLEALQALQNRSLLEKRDGGFTLQNVIIEYTTEYLIEHVCQEITDFRLLLLDDTANKSPTTIQSAKSKIQSLFLNRFALLKAQSKAYVRQTQERLILQPLVERLVSGLGKAELANVLQQIVAQLRAVAPSDSGYIAGNLLNLLVQLGVDLSGHDFSGLTIRQAYLQGVTLHNVALTNAVLQQCVFTNTFGAVLSIAISPDNRLLATATNDSMVRIWQLSDGQPYQLCEGHTNVVREVVFSPDGRWLASASLDHTVRLWEVATGALRYTFNGHTDGIYSVVFCRQGSVLASGGCDNTIRLWDVNTGQPLRVLTGHTDLIHRLASDPTGVWLASGSADHTVRLWEIDSGENIEISGHTDSVTCLAFSPDGALLATGSADQTIRLWDLSTQETCQILHGHTHWLRAVVFSPDGALLASASADYTVRLWDVAGGEVRGLLQGHTNAVWSLAFRTDGQLVSGGVDHQLRVWDVQNPTDSRAINVVQAHVGAVLAIAVSPDGQMMATGHQHNLVRLWDVQSRQQLAVLAGHTSSVRSVAFSPDGGFLVSTSNDRTVRLWDVAQRRTVQTLTGHPHQAHYVTYHPSGDFVASSGYKDGVRVWDLRSPHVARLLHLLKPPETEQTTSASGIAFSPDGRYLASVHNDDKLYIWDVNSGEWLQHLHSSSNELEWIAWSPDGATLAGVDSRGVIQLWDVDTLPHSQKRRTIGGNIYPWGVTFSPDSRLLASVGEDPLIRLWDVQNGACVQTLSGHSQNVTGVAFFPDGKTLVSSSYDSTLRFWHVQTGELLTTLHIPGPYAGMKIHGVTGISDAQKAALRALGAVDA